MVDENKLELGKNTRMIGFLVNLTAKTGDNVAGGILNNLCTDLDARNAVISQPNGIAVLHKIASEGLPVDFKPGRDQAWVK